MASFQGVRRVGFSLLAACATDGDAADGDSSTDSGTAPPASSDSSDASSGSGAWPDCGPVLVADQSFRGPDATGQDRSSAVSALCVFESLAVTELQPEPPGLGARSSFEHQLKFRDCREAGGDSPLSLDASFVTGESISLRVEVGDEVKVESIRNELDSLGGGVEQWYAIRAAFSAELIFAAFADRGPTVAPKRPSASPDQAWLSPLEIELGEPACPVETEGTVCAGSMPQRAMVELRTGADALDVLSGTIGEIDGYRLHLGFAGVSNECDFGPEHLPIEGIVFSR